MYFSIVKVATLSQTELYSRTNSVNMYPIISLSDEDKLQIVLNFKPLWKKVNENEACVDEAIYAFVKNTYQSAQGLNFSTSVT